MDADLLLIHRIRNGDEDAIEIFVKKYYPAILRYCTYRVSDKQQAEDLTQETFYNFFKSFRTYSHKGKLANYLYVIAGNLCRDYWRLEKKKQHDQLSENTEQDISTLDLDSRLDIEKAIRDLPEEFREVVNLHYFLGMKLKEIADAEGISLTLVKYRLKRGKDILKDLLREEGQP